ncbi:MAG: hypothetical protein ACYSWO_12970 [Planctomycetota bacterium]|jgi:hypothetical protein
MDTIVKLFRWFVTVPEGPRTVGRIIVWWELRRIPYNIIVGVLGVTSLTLFYFFILHCDVLAPGEDAVEPIALFAAPFFINIAYTAGWIVELMLKVLSRRENRRVGPILFKLGLEFSIIVVFLPAVIWGVEYLSYILTQ